MTAWQGAVTVPVRTLRFEETYTPMSERVKPDGYNTPVPAKILTPDRVETRIGTLEFADGFPTEATSRLLYDHLDFLRGVEAFLNGVPAASLEAMRMGMEEVGVKACHQSEFWTVCWTRRGSS